MHSDLPQLIEPLLSIGRRAGKEILKIYGSEFTVETKADNSPLTAADQAAHNLIVEALGELTPDIPVWSEESATISFEERSRWQQFWLVDPLDGTREFIKRNGEFTVNIALIRDHEPVMGVVHVPVSGRDYFGYQDHGEGKPGGSAFVAEAGGVPEAITVTARAENPVRVVGSRSHAGPELQTYLDALGPHVMLPMGSSLKLCLVAAGEADVYPRIGLTSEWDTAAAQAVVECAGGHVTDLRGQRLLYNTKAEVLNPYFLVFGEESDRWTAAAAGLEQLS